MGNFLVFFFSFLNVKTFAGFESPPPELFTDITFVDSGFLAEGKIVAATVD